MAIAVRIRLVDEFRRPAKVLERAHRKALYGAAAYCRKVARSSIKRRKRIVSTPGQPPYHRAPATRSVKHILFDVDVRKRSAIIGPVKFANSSAHNLLPALERGGVSVRRGTRYFVRARPFMEPAGTKTKPKLQEFYAKELRRGG